MRSRRTTLRPPGPRRNGGLPRTRRVVRRMRGPCEPGWRRAAVGDGSAIAAAIDHGRGALLDPAGRGRSCRRVQRPRLRGRCGRAAAPAHAATCTTRRSSSTVDGERARDRARAFAGRRRGEPGRRRHRRRRQPAPGLGGACSATRSAAGAAARSRISATPSAPPRRLTDAIRPRPAGCSTCVADRPHAGVGSRRARAPARCGTPTP